MFSARIPAGPLRAPARARKPCAALALYWGALLHVRCWADTTIAVGDTAEEIDSSEYVFESPDGPVTLAGLSADRWQCMRLVAGNAFGAAACRLTSYSSTH